MCRLFALGILVVISCTYASPINDDDPVLRIKRQGMTLQQSLQNLQNTQQQQSQAQRGTQRPNQGSNRPSSSGSFGQGSNRPSSSGGFSQGSGNGFSNGEDPNFAFNNQGTGFGGGGSNGQGSGSQGSGGSNNQGLGSGGFGNGNQGFENEFGMSGFGGSGNQGFGGSGSQNSGGFNNQGSSGSQGGSGSGNQGGAQPWTTIRSPINVINNENSIPEAPCIRTCLSVNNYDPVCGSDNITYTNRAKFRCAQQCGRVVNEVYRGSCVTTPAPN